MSQVSRRATSQLSLRGHERELTIFGHEGEYVFERIRSSGGFYEAPVLKALSYLPLRQDTIVIDVGANIGNHTLYFAEFLQRPVIAVEPFGGNADLLEANLGINNLRERVRVVRAALWDSSTRLNLSQNIENNSGTFTATAAADGSVDGVTLDDVVGADGPVGLIKVDTEGSEPQVLRGALKTIERDRPFLCVEAHDGESFRTIANLLAPLGYEVLDVEGYSDNFIWAHAESLSSGNLDAIRQMSSRVASRRLRQHMDSRIDALFRRIDRAEEHLKQPGEAVSDLTRDVRDEVVAALRAHRDEASSLTESVSEDIRSGMSTLADDLRRREAAAQGREQDLRARLARQADMMSVIAGDRAAKELEADRLRHELDRVQEENRLWKQAYGGLASSRPTKAASTVLRLFGKRRELLAPAAREKWVQRRAKRSVGSSLEVRDARHMYEVSAVTPPRSDIVRAGMAAIPERLDGLKRVVERMYDQVDELFVYLNRFTEIPEFLRGDSRVRVFMGADLGDRGKFRFVDDFTGYFFSIDDDIDYPRFYVEHMIDGIERYERKAAVGWHGSILKDEFRDYYKDASRRVLSYRTLRGQDTPVHVLGTGCAAFHTSTLKLSLDNFPTPNMADIHFAVQGQRQKVPFIVLAHEAGWADALQLADARSISSESMAKTGNDAFDVRAETNRIVSERRPWTIHKTPKAIVREPLTLAVVGRTDHARWKKGGILKSSNLTGEMLRPLGVDVRLFDLETGDSRNLDGFRPKVVMIYPGDPQRPDFVECERLVEHHADRGSVVVINLSLNMRDQREAYIVERLTAWRERYGRRVHALVFADQARDIPAFDAVRDSVVAVPKTIEVPHVVGTSFHETNGIFLGDFAKLVNDDLFSTPPAERWLDAIRRAVPEAPLYAVRQYQPKERRELGVTILPFLRDDYSEILSGMRLMVSPFRHVTFEMVPPEVAALGVPVVYHKMEHALSAYLGMGGIEVESPEQLADTLPDLYRDPTVWRMQSRAGQRRATSLDYRLMASQMYLRLKALSRHATI